MTRADNNSWGKSLGFRVAINAACPCSAQAQNGLSSGSGEISSLPRISTASASSRSRLITAPMRFRRTPSRAKTSLYSIRISLLMSHVNVPFSIQFRRSAALGFLTGLSDLNPAIPATRTEVSITPLGRSWRAANRYLRQTLLFGSVPANRFGNLEFRNTRQISCRLLQFAREFTFPSGSLSPTRQVLIPRSTRKLLFQFHRKVRQRNTKFDGFAARHWTRGEPHVARYSPFSPLQAVRDRLCKACQ